MSLLLAKALRIASSSDKEIGSAETIPTRVVALEPMEFADGAVTGFCSFAASVLGVAPTFFANAPSCALRQMVAEANNATIAEYLTKRFIPNGSKKFSCGYGTL